MNPAVELRTAAYKVRSWVAETEAARWAPSAITAFGPDLAEWLDHESNLAHDAHLWTDRESCGWCGEPANAHALAVARAINGTAP
ncbi:hypothetical protein RKD48_006639 [Streptomyces ambofaciens]